MAPTWLSQANLLVFTREPSVAWTAPAFGPKPEKLAVLLLLLPLRGDGFHGRLHLLRISQIVTAQRLQIVVELINQRHPGRDIHPHDSVFGNIVEILHQRPQAVAMRRDQHAFAMAYSRRDGR